MIPGHRRKTKSRRRAGNGQTALTGLGFKFCERLLLPAIDPVFNRPPLCEVFLALKRFGEGRLHVLDEFVHSFLEQNPLAGRQAQSLRVILALEVDDITPIRRHRLFPGNLIEILKHQRTFAGPGSAHRKNVVAGVLDVRAKAHSFNGARLPNDIGQILQIISRLKIKGFKIAVPVD